MTLPKTKKRGVSRASNSPRVRASAVSFALPHQINDHAALANQ